MDTHHVELKTTRRNFLASATAVGAMAMASKAVFGAEPDAKAQSPARDWSLIRGFNYQPSYGSSGFELWQKFDATVIDRELGLGRKYFPRINAIRLWLSWDSFVRNPKRFGESFDTALTIADKHGLVVMPVLFNRWHDAALDYGGIYIDHFLPGASWIYQPNLFDAYMSAIVGAHKDDARILAWDLCNEPFSYGCAPEAIPEIDKAEFNWLKGLYDKCKQLGASSPVTVGIHPGVPLPKINPIADVLSIHPYWMHNIPGASKEAYEKSLDDAVAFAAQVKKPLLATECCWGSQDDAVRVESVRYTLTQLQKRKIGYLVYLLHHSLVADAHRLEFGPLSTPGNLAFIEADGRLRPGHEVFNEFQ